MKINKKEVSGYKPCFRRHLALCFLCLIFNILKANTEFQFNQLGTLDGLSGNNITCVHQDQTGFIWIGTTYGLNRYDGSNVYTYQNNPFDSTSILSNRVNCILEDNETNLWIGTEEGLTRYNHFTNSFSHYEFEASYASTETLNFILSIYQDSRDELWITSRFGLIKFNHNSGEYSIYFPNTTIKQVLEDKQNSFWVASWENGLVEFNRDIETWAQYLPPKDLSERTNNQLVYPNPLASGILTIELPTESNYVITMTSISGQVVYRTTTTDSRHEINSEILSKGIYVLSIQSENFLNTKRVIVK